METFFKGMSTKSIIWTGIVKENSVSTFSRMPFRK